MSPREATAERFAEACRFGGLDQSYGVIKSKQTDQKGKTYWSVTFALNRILDGVIRIYSPTWILVEYTTGIRKLPQQGREVFKSEGAALDFIAHNFINT